MAELKATHEEPVLDDLYTQEYHLGRIERRAEHLKRRVTSVDPPNEWEQYELNAMLWAIPLLRAHIDRQRNLFAHFARRFPQYEEKKSNKVPGRGIEPLP